MSEKKKLVVVVTHGFDNERASVAWNIANGGINSDFEVTMFLVASGVDWVRKGALEVAQMNPLVPPIKDMIQKVIDSGGKIQVCPPCPKVRGYAQEDLIDGIVITGSQAMLEKVAQGAPTLTFYVSAGSGRGQSTVIHASL